MLPRRRQRWSLKTRILIFILLLLTGGGLVVGGLIFAFQGRREPFSGPTWTVKREKLKLTIVERGALESADNSDIICRVKTGIYKSITIKSVIDNGKEVKKGDLLVELEDSSLKEQERTFLNQVNEASAASTSADEEYRITESQNFSEIESAKVNLVLAELDLKKYIGEKPAQKLIKLLTRRQIDDYLTKVFPKETDLKSPGGEVSEYLKARNEIEGKIEVARSDREMYADRASYSQRMMTKGFLSRSQAAADQARLDSAEIALRNMEIEQAILGKYTLEQKVTELWSKVKEAERAIHRVETQAKAKEVQARSKKESKRTIHEQELDKLRELQREIAKCRIYSPQDGLVVYHIPDQARFGIGGQQSTIAQGEKVNEGQKLMRIPNLKKMLVIVKVHEAMVARVRGEIRIPTGFQEGVHAAVFAGQTNPLGLVLAIPALEDLRDELHADYKELEHKVLYKGQPAIIRIEAQHGKQYNGFVKSKDTVASQADWMSTDVRVYQTTVSIEDLVSDLNPGMSAEVTILADQSQTPVLSIPIQAVVGSVGSGNKRKCFVIDAEGQPRERDIEVGMSNDKMVEVVSGLEEDEKVALNPRPLLGEKSDLRPGVPAKTRGADGSEGFPGQKAGDGKKGGFPGGMDGKKGGFPGGMDGKKGGFPGGGGVPPGGANPTIGNPPGGGGLPPAVDKKNLK